MYILTMVKINAVKGGKLTIRGDVEEIYTKMITPYGNGAKIDSMKKYVGRKAFVIVLKERW